MKNAIKREKIGHALLSCWKKDEALRLQQKTPSPKTPLMYFLEYNYKERHVALCTRLGIKPKTLGNWLLTPVSDIA